LWIGNCGEINHSPEIAANDSQGTKTRDFVILELIENDPPPHNLMANQFPRRI
jgi:hypothetical protein